MCGSDNREERVARYCVLDGDEAVTIVSVEHVDGRVVAGSGETSAIRRKPHPPDTTAKFEYLGQAVLPVAKGWPGGFEL